jgi:uncharacterized protein (DUF488 family)
MQKVETFTIGFTQTTAENFFSRLKNASIRRLLDVRLNNTSQLAGFAKAADLRYFLKTIADIDYAHEPNLAPTESMLTAFKKEKGDWSIYRTRFMNLMELRRVEERFNSDSLAGACLLCSEAKPHNCHRQLVCEYLNGKWGGVLNVRHL